MADTTEKAEAVRRAIRAVGETYTRELKSYGVDPRSVGHKTKADQYLRFEKLAAAITPSLAKSGISVNDYGCGYGEMLRYLDGIGVKVTKYIGYDVSQEMLDLAGKEIGGARVRLIKTDKVTESADYSFISGIFNVRLDAAEEAWTDYIKETLLQVAAKSKRGMSFYLLSTYVDWKNERFYYGDPFMFFDFCKRNISKYVALHHDYPLYEWTITIRMEGSVK